MVKQKGTNTKVLSSKLTPVSDGTFEEKVKRVQIGGLYDKS